LRDSGRTGIAKIIIREAQQLAAVEVIDNAIVLTLLRYADELVDTSQLSFPAGEKPRKAELDMARMLIDNLASEWEPSKYTDEYRDNLMTLIQARIKGEKPRLPAAKGEPQGGEVVDLMERLRQSLASRNTPARRSTGAGPARTAKTKRPAGRKARHAA
jgi:DNA end-binding protein Ku